MCHAGQHKLTYTEAQIDIELELFFREAGRVPNAVELFNYLFYLPARTATRLSSETKGRPTLPTRMRGRVSEEVGFRYLGRNNR